MSARKAIEGDPRQTSFNFFLPSQGKAALPAIHTKTTSDDFDHGLRGMIAATLDECARRAVAPMDRERV
ncbi:MAG: hypothetical protein JXQ84_01885, partial [Rhodospirillaceae bacterium]|nr:hypothetical protein [Rhodospirillaceae bacterium]